MTTRNFIAGSDRASLWRLLAILLTALLLGGAGCSDDDPPIEGVITDPPPGLPFPGSPDQLVANFRSAYETMDFSGLRSVLHPAFETHLQQRTRDEFPAVGPTLDVAEELVIAERMFSGTAITNSQGTLVQGLSAVSFLIFERANEWTTAGATDVVPGASTALFETTILLDRPGGATLRTDGLLKIYVAGRDTVIGGETKSFYQMIGQVDLTSATVAGKGVEETPWGTLKALFW